MFAQPITPWRGAARKREPHGGDERDRTVDPLLAKQVLSQLSYAPKQVEA